MMNEWRALGITMINFNNQQGWLSLKNPGYQPSDLEWEAVQYLCDEWDYAIEVPPELSDDE